MFIHQIADWTLLNKPFHFEWFVLVKAELSNSAGQIIVCHFISLYIAIYLLTIFGLLQNIFLKESIAVSSMELTEFDCSDLLASLCCNIYLAETEIPNVSTTPTSAQGK